MKILGVIPARFASTRFPGKPLALIHGVSMIQRVYIQSQKAASLADVVVATDDERIYKHVLEFGGRVVMTSSDHPSGTDRCAEVLRNNDSGFDAVVNIQGDEPFIKPTQIDLLTSCFSDPSCQIATLVKKISSKEELENFNTPKVVMGEKGRAVYFSRRAVPFVPDSRVSEHIQQGSFFKHIGIYAYRADILGQLAALPPTQAEKMESLEQLRWLCNGISIYTRVTNDDSHAVDVPGDIQLIERLYSI